MRVYDIYLKYKKLQMYKKFNINKYMCDIENPLNIDSTCRFIHKGIGVIIAPSCKIGKHCTIYQYTTIGGRDTPGDKAPVIGNNVTIYSYCCILGNIYIGDNSIIGAYSLVLDNIPENSIAYGIPARVIKKNEGTVE